MSVALFVKKNMKFDRFDHHFLVGEKLFVKIFILYETIAKSIKMRMNNEVVAYHTKEEIMIQQLMLSKLFMNI